MIKKAQPSVTIGIPTYNRAGGYLGEALASALNQTYQNIEIIVSDNCSSDNTEAFIRSFSDPRLRYFRHNKNIGANNNFNYCLEQAKGDYFLLLHDDDLIDENFVEICMTNANYANDFGIIRTGTRVIDSKGEVLHESPNMVVGLSTEEFFLAWFRCKTSWYLCSTLFNTKRLRQIGRFQSKHQLLPDGVAIAKLAAQYDRIDVEDVKASFRKHAGEITFAVNVKNWCEDFLYLLDLICKLSPENKAVLRAEGERFFAKLNYNRASAVQSPLKRFLAYLIVFRKFNHKHLPPPVRRFIYQNPLSLFVRNKKRRT